MNNLIDMLLSKDNSNFILAEIMIDKMISLDMHEQLKPLHDFLKNGIYDNNINSFEINEDIIYIKEKLDKYFNTKP